MIATNHGLVGTIIGATMPLEYAIPAALASHVVMDMMPHYGIEFKKRNRSKSYKWIVFTDTFVALSIALVTALFGQWQMFWIGWLSYGPDGYWVWLYFRGNRSFILKSNNWLAKFHHRIQVFERPWGLVVDLIVVAVLLPIYVHYLTA